MRSLRLEGVDRLKWCAGQTDKEKEWHAMAEQERIAYKSVLQLDGMHKAYEKLLKDAEDRLMKMYGSAADTEKRLCEKGREGI